LPPIRALDRTEFPLFEYSLIESLYKRGYLIRQSKKSEMFYKSNMFDQILKRFVNDNPKYQELHHKEKSLFQEFISEIFLKEMKASKKPVYRVVPIEKTLKDKRQLIPFHQAAHFLQKSPAIVLIDCICGITFNKCDKPREVCIVLGDQAEFFIDRGIGEKIDTG
jgi:hypothetical protein